MRLPFVLNQPPVWKNFSVAERDLNWAAANKLVESLQNLNESGLHAVQTVIGGRTFVEWDHYPDDDVRDDKNASQYFYHAHPGLQRPFVEHGHFHLFVHAESLGLRKKNSRFEPAPAHLVAVSMNAIGMPSGFFTVNRWVTKGPWLSFKECEIGLKHFKIAAKHGKKDVNVFLQSLVQLYYQKILALLRQRDEIMEKLCDGRDRRSVFADEQIEVLCYTPIDIMEDIAALEELMESNS